MKPMTDREIRQTVNELLAAGDNTAEKKDAITRFMQRIQRIVQLEELRKQEIEKII